MKFIIIALATFVVLVCICMNEAATCGENAGRLIASRRIQARRIQQRAEESRQAIQRANAAKRVPLPR